MSAQKIIVNAAGTVAYSKELSVAIKTGAKVTQPVIDDSTSVGYGDIIPWGENNDKPQRLIKAVKKSTILAPGLDKLSRFLYSGGLVYGTVGYNDRTGEEELKPMQDPEINAFLKYSKANHYLAQGSKAFYYFKNTFPELILSKDKKKIVSLSSQRPEYCRYEKQNKQGNIDRVFINANFGTGLNESDDKFTTKVKLLDAYGDCIEQIKEASDFKFIYPVLDHTPGTSFYQDPEWASVIDSGWYDVAQSIPQFKKKLFENQITIKYIIEVSTWWWNWKYPGFDGFDAKKKKELMDEELKRFINFMTGTDATANSLMVTFESNPQMQKEYPGWKITPVDNKIKDGIYIEDSQEASSHHFSAMGVDPTLIGTAPGSKMGAGSGSDKNAAMKIHLATCKPHQDKILEPYNELIADYNGWSKRIPNLKFWMANYWKSTISLGKESQQQAA